jgi:hypothetical protein
MADSSGSGGETPSPARVGSGGSGASGSNAGEEEGEVVGGAAGQAGPYANRLIVLTKRLEVRLQLNILPI